MIPLLRRQNIVTALATIVIVATIPFAVIDTIKNGRVYTFSVQFLEELPHRFVGPGRLRFIFQPIMAVLIGVRGGLADARAGNPHFLFGILFASGRRKESLLNGLTAIRNVLALGIIMDVVFQLILYRRAHPGAALLIGPIFVCAPYAIARELTNRLAGLVARTNPDYSPRRHGVTAARSDFNHRSANHDFDSDKEQIN